MTPAPYNPLITDLNTIPEAFAPVPGLPLRMPPVERSVSRVSNSVGAK